MKFGIGIPVALAGALACGMASAKTVNLKYNGGTANGSVENITAPVAPEYDPAGAYGFNMEETGATSIGMGTFVAWCLDIADGLKEAASNYEITSDPFDGNIISSAAIDRVQNVFDANYGSLDYNDDDEAASFQVALWDALYDDDADYTKGAFKLKGHNGTDLGDANTFLSKASNYSGGKRYNLTFLDNMSGGQDLVTASPVPVPAAGVLLLTAIGGIGGFGAIRRKRKAA